MHAEVLVLPERRRHWTFAEKARIVAQSYEPGASVAGVARRHGLAQNLLFRWRQLARAGRLGGSQPAPRFVPVATTPQPFAVPSLIASASPAADAAGLAGLASSGAGRPRTGLIEIALAGGRRVTVDRDVDGDALRRVLDVVDRP
jgi:transposase